MRNFSDKNRRENQNTHFMFNNLPTENHVVYETVWKNIVQPKTPQMTIWRMRTACWIPKATNTISEWVIFIAFPLQQWLHDRASLFRYMYDVCCSFAYFVLDVIMLLLMFFIVTLI
jgi:hypothetical protein